MDGYLNNKADKKLILKPPHVYEVGKIANPNPIKDTESKLLEGPAFFGKFNLGGDSDPQGAVFVVDFQQSGFLRAMKRGNTDYERTIHYRDRPGDH